MRFIVCLMVGVLAAACGTAPTASAPGAAVAKPADPPVVAPAPPVVAPAPPVLAPASPVMAPASPVAPPYPLPVSIAERMLTHPSLANYWHPDKPGRVPVRIVASAAIRERPGFEMHGVPVVWVDSGATKSGFVYVELDATPVGNDLRVTLRYPVEGVVATGTFAPYPHDAWLLQGDLRVVEQ